MMRPKTAAAAISILELVNQLLRDGRPRKPLYGKRPAAEYFSGEPTNRVTKNTNLFAVKKVSLPGAFAFVKASGDFTPYQVREAECELSWSAWRKGWGWLTTEELDELVMDTREIRRLVKATAKQVEQDYLLRR